MSATSVPFAASTMAAAAVRGCSTNLAKRACTNLAFVSRHKETNELFRPQGYQGFSPNLAKRSCSNLAFVPQHKETQERDIELLQQFLNQSKKLLVLTGAGITILHQNILRLLTALHALHRDLNREWNPRLPV